jgi:hypothetical protein
MGVFSAPLIKQAPDAESATPVFRPVVTARMAVVHRLYVRHYSGHRGTDCRKILMRKGFYNHSVQSGRNNEARGVIGIS